MLYKIIILRCKLVLNKLEEDMLFYKNKSKSEYAKNLEFDYDIEDLEITKEEHVTIN